ncbi:putative alpha-amylase [Rosa chinensis]|uniref:Putative alpha-amylase n=1 Tax=Rosa chinensis TaxID=74649 RepID=A0A2P6QFH9_ROSCH|nr:putative alpha-amylase [Rosa chinensis]PRQ33277.1 putative alpha-amylase [Rosa chinensis]PRQ50179.1 putative alpha-amylase [Rosa chinensis]
MISDPAKQGYNFILCAYYLQGYAYILTQPGIPSVFYDHFYDSGDSIHDQIVKLVQQCS